eukprot:TRINITY_DN10236_c0_g1_i3.p1 TRINITY_DN10236_c0_g1~~TRINITY_DN10236_c0_g1_i3.p1  ORF type:complete len:103 (-),score=8.29 TRINITY_DN10236_c0_g1_i3:63-371(-)
MNAVPCWCAFEAHVFVLPIIQCIILFRDIFKQNMLQRVYLFTKSILWSKPLSIHVKFRLAADEYKDSSPARMLVTWLVIQVSLEWVGPDPAEHPCQVKYGQA